MYHALSHACKIFNVLPVKGLQNPDGNTATPYELFVGSKPKIHHFRVFGCPLVTKKWSTPQTSSGKQTKRGIRGIFIGLDNDQKGYLFYAPGTHQIYISGDVMFDESFGTIIATNWQMLHDSLSLRPVTSAPPTVDTTIECTGSIAHFPTIAEEGRITEDDDVPDNVPELLHPGDDNSVSTSGYDDDDELDEIEDDDDILAIEHGNSNDNADEVSPQPVSMPLRRSTRT
jgi:hypothetical protein